MKHVFCLLLAAGLLAGATSCNKSSFIEGVGAATNTTAAATATTGKITFYCTNYKMSSGCGRLGVYVDHDYKGDIVGQASGTVQCGSSTKALTLELSPGSHNFSISGSSSTCPRYTFSASVTKGSCVSHELQ